VLKISAHPRLRRYGKRFLIVAACVFAFYAVEHWRGRRNWIAFRTEWEVRGERFDRTVVPVIPDDQNAAMVPLMGELTEIWRAHPDWFQYTRKPQVHDRGRLHQVGRMLAVTPASKHRTFIEKIQRPQFAGGGWPNGEFLSQDEAEAAREIVAHFDEFSEILGEIDTMLARPAIALPAIDRNDVQATGPPHADVLNSIFRAFHLRARAQILLGNGTAALADIERSMTIGKLLRDERANHSRSLWMSNFQFTAIIPVIWEGLYSNAWNADELERLQRHIDDVDFAPGFLAYQRYVRSLDIDAATSSKERSLHNARMKVRNARSQSMGSPVHYQGYPFAERFRPQGWRYEDLTNRMRNWQQALFTKDDGSVNFDTVTLKMVTASAALAPRPIREPGAVQEALRQAAERLGLRYDPIISQQSLPELGYSAQFLVERYLFQRANLQRLSSTAIAIECFRLERQGLRTRIIVDNLLQFDCEATGLAWKRDDSIRT
jgi:hypothetical protein